MSTDILLIIDKLQKLPLTRLQTLWEWKNRVLLEEYYTFNLVIPPEDESGNKSSSQVNSSHGRKSSHHSTRLAEFLTFILLIGDSEHPGSGRNRAPRLGATGRITLGNTR